MYAKSETTIASILDAAEVHFVGRSYPSVSMQDIAEEAAVTKGALYHHFDSKEALYSEMMQRDLDAKREIFAEAIARVGGARNRLLRLTECFLDLPPLKRGLIQLVRRDINFFNDDIRREIVRTYQAALPDQVESVIRDGIRAGEIARGEPRLLAWSFIALVEVILTPYAESVLAERQQMLDHVLGLFFEGAQANGATLT